MRHGDARRILRRPGTLARVLRAGMRVRFQDPESPIAESERGLELRGRLLHIEVGGSSEGFAQVLADGRTFAIWLRPAQVRPE